MMGIIFKVVDVFEENLYTLPFVTVTVLRPVWPSVVVIV